MIRHQDISLILPLLFDLVGNTQTQEFDLSFCILEKRCVYHFIMIIIFHKIRYLVIHGESIPFHFLVMHALYKNLLLRQSYDSLYTCLEHLKYLALFLMAVCEPRINSFSILLLFFQKQCNNLLENKAMQSYIVLAGKEHLRLFDGAIFSNPIH